MDWTAVESGRNQARSRRHPERLPCGSHGRPDAGRGTANCQREDAVGCCEDPCLCATGAWLSPTAQHQTTCLICEALSRNEGTLLENQVRHDRARRTASHTRDRSVPADRARRSGQVQPAHNSRFLAAIYHPSFQRTPGAASWIMTDQCLVSEGGGSSVTRVLVTR